MSGYDDPSSRRARDWKDGTLNTIAIVMTVAVIFGVLKGIDVTVLIGFEGTIVGFFFGKAAAINQKRQHRATDPQP